MVNEQQLKNALVNLGFKEDRFGNMIKELGITDGIKNTLRVKVNSISARYEYLIRGRWYIRSSDYFRNITIKEDGSIIIAKKRLLKR